MTPSSPASMGGPLSEAAFVEAVGRYSLDQIRAYLAGPPALIGPDHGRDLDRMAWLLDLHDSVRDKLHRVADESRQLQERLDAATAQLRVLGGQLATAQEQLASVRNLQEIEIGRHWNSHSEAEAQGRNATLREVQQILDGGDPPRSDLTQTEVRNRFQRHIAALGLDGGDPDGR